MGDAVSRWLRNHKVRQIAKVPTPEHHHHHDFRTAIVKWFEWGIEHEPQIHYAERRPIPVHQRPGTLPLTTDCSGFFTVCYAWAGAPDPNGLGYSGAGFTGTLLSHGKEVIHPRPGDACIFGPGNGHHVAGVLSVEGSEIWLSSHGQERGPMKILLSVEAAYQPAGIRFRSYL